MSLLIDQSIAQCEQLLQNVITWGLKKVKITVADPNSLRAVASRGASTTPIFTTDDLAFVTSKNNKYRWKQASAAADDGDLVIAPTDAGATGRWLKVVTDLLYDDLTVASKTDGVIKNVILHSGDFDPDVLKERVYAQRPCVAIHFAGEKHETESQITGALYDYRVRFEIWSVSSNFRDRFEAALGSDVQSEFAEDPGVLRIHGQVKKLLAGKQGEELDEPGIKAIEIFDGDLIESEETERLFVMALQIEVRGSIHNPDNPAVLSQPTEIAVQRNQVQAAESGSFSDTQDCVLSGFEVPPAVGFTGTVLSGSALVGTNPVTVGDTLQVFPASSDTYRDLTPAGAWVFASVANGGAAPSRAQGNLRVGVTVTDAAGIVGDAFLCSVEKPFPAADTPDIDGVGFDPLRIDVVPLEVALGVAGTQQLQAIGYFQDGSSRDVSAVVTWGSTDITVATVSGSGLAAGVARGSCSATATYQGRTGTAPITVS